MNLAHTYLQPLESTLKSVVDLKLSEAPEFGLMIRYAMGWQNADSTPYIQTTGKRLRPLLVFLCTEASGGEWQEALPLASAVELLHNFSLIHDDIQDSSEIRHNRPTVWKVWGVANAINAGDALFTLAYRAIELLFNRLPDELILEVIKIFNTTNIELTRGQHLDMRFERINTVSIEDYISMISGKSAKLLATSAQFGAIIGSKDLKVAEYYADFGQNLGIAFQIHDDILGIWGDPAITGKSAASDIISRKKSFPVLYGLSKSQALTKLYEKPIFDTKDIEEAVRILTEIGAKDHTLTSEEVFYERAFASLDNTSPTNTGLETLKSFTQFLFQRDY